MEILLYGVEVSPILIANLVAKFSATKSNIIHGS